MLFSSTVFVFLFLPLVLGLYFALGRRARNLVLLASSLLFYAWGEKLLVVLMLLSITANYGFGRWLEGAQERAGGRGKEIVALAVVFNIGLLVLFKYADWLWLFLQGAPGIGAWITSPGLRRLLLTEEGGVRLPIGISFFTFQALSYVIDVYRRQASVQRNPIDFALYIALFPQLIAGPIVRYHDVASQIASRIVTRPLFAEGVRRFVIGLGKKMLVANVAARVADDIFAIGGGELPAAVAWLGVVCYTIQIYFDFSGYSDMAIGLGRMFGFRLLENFDYPYVSKSITEFWRRWHISLSSWFRDYLYIPLGGNRRGAARTYVNLVCVFLLCGLWHGAAWNFLAWGLFHGGFLVLERLGLGRWLEARHAVIRRVYVMGVVVVGWVLFRSPTLAYALDYLAAMSFLAAGDALTHTPLLWLDSVVVLALSAGVIGSTPWLPRLARSLAEPGRELQRTAFGALGLMLLMGVFLLSALELSAGTYNPFIYFRF
jgi:alginate O-acetyltransferase complex protein AlgI